jgi:hypothetical protein
MLPCCQVAGKSDSLLLHASHCCCQLVRKPNDKPKASNKAREVIRNGGRRVRSIRNSHLATRWHQPGLVESKRQNEEDKAPYRRLSNSILESLFAPFLWTLSTCRSLYQSSPLDHLHLLVVWSISIYFAERSTPPLAEFDGENHR